MKHALTLSLALLLSACDGPWNMDSGSGSSGSLPKLSVSGTVVAGLTYDTIWITRSIQLSVSYDSTREFVDTSRSKVRVIRLDGAGAPDTVSYRLSSNSGVAWIAARSDTARHGARYRLEADLVWDSAQSWGSGATVHEWKRSEIRATTYTPSVFAQGPVFAAPLEALSERLARSGYAALKAAIDSGTFAFPADLDVTPATLDSVAAGIPVYRPIHSGAPVWYIRSSESVVGLDGAASIRQDRPYLIPQTIQRSGFGGVLAFQRFDTTRARILDPVTQVLQSSIGRSFDSAGYYQPGQFRITDFYAAYQSSFWGWPDTLQLPSLDIGYTGRNVFYAYAMDSLYELHLNGLSSSNTSLPYTNIRDGLGATRTGGYFAGAAVDSFVLDVRSPTADTFQVGALKTAWCAEKRRKALKGGSAVPAACN